MRAGVDLGGTKIEALVIEGDHEVVGRARAATPRSGGATAIVEAIVQAVRTAAEAAGVGYEQLSGIGVGSPGAVDEEAGTAGFNSNLAGGWTEPYPLAQQLSRLLGRPVRVANDVEVAADAELELGAGRELSLVERIDLGAVEERAEGLE